MTSRYLLSPRSARKFRVPNRMCRPPGVSATPKRLFSSSTESARFTVAYTR